MESCILFAVVHKDLYGLPRLKVVHVAPGVQKVLSCYILDLIRKEPLFRIKPLLTSCKHRSIHSTY